MRYVTRRKYINTYKSIVTFRVRYVAICLSILKDERYREVFDNAINTFNYYVNKSPLNLTKTTKSEKEYLEDMYDL